MSYHPTQKPINIFYVWYTELCRRLNSSPASVIKPAKLKCPTVLNFLADRVKLEEWNPLISALRHDTSLHAIAIKSRIGNCPFLHDVDTEEKLRHMKRRSGSLWTTFVLKSLLKSLSNTIRNTQVLTCLELEGLPMFSQYLEPLMKALQKNKTLKTLSLRRCRISDTGCQLVCTHVRFTPNIEVLNLSGCALTELSGEYLAKLIKHQQINRYCESWHNSLRYSDPNINSMRGIKRITLNQNELFGDQGLDPILSELIDDLWIKALDMQNCGITEKMAMRILDLVQYSQSLEIVDFRLNDEMDISTIDKILNTLKENHLDRQPEFQWCGTSYTLTCDSMMDTMSNYTTIKTPHSLHKVKSAPIKNKPVMVHEPVRKSKTMTSVNIQEIIVLKNQLQEEIARRKETEKVNEELKRQLEEVTSRVPLTNGVKKMALNVTIPQNGFKKNGYHKNGFNTNGDVASSIFEKLLSRDNVEDQNSDEEGFLEYFNEERVEAPKMKNGYDMSESQLSLVRFMKTLKTNVPTAMK